MTENDFEAVSQVVTKEKTDPKWEVDARLQIKTIFKKYKM
jgi:hypothetical protein